MIDLLPQEQANVRTALRYMRRRAGGWKVIAKTLGFQYDTVTSVVDGKRNVTGGMAVRVARVAGVTVDALLAGEYTPKGTCPMCGYHADTGRVASEPGARRLSSRGTFQP